VKFVKFVFVKIAKSTTLWCGNK